MFPLYSGSTQSLDYGCCYTAHSHCLWTGHPNNWPSHTSRSSTDGFLTTISTSYSKCPEVKTVLFTALALPIHQPTGRCQWLSHACLQPSSSPLGRKQWLACPVTLLSMATNMISFLCDVWGDFKKKNKTCWLPSIQYFMKDLPKREQNQSCTDRLLLVMYLHTKI